MERVAQSLPSTRYTNSDVSRALQLPKPLTGKEVYFTLWLSTSALVAEDHIPPWVCDIFFKGKHSCLKVQSISHLTLRVLCPAQRLASHDQGWGVQESCVPCTDLGHLWILDYVLGIVTDTFRNQLHYFREYWCLCFSRQLIYIKWTVRPVEDSGSHLNSSL